MMRLGFRIGLLNLWLPFALGYFLIWLAAILSGRGVKREKVGQTDEYINKRLMYLFGFYPFVALFIVSIFVPINFGILFWIGLLTFVFGIAMNIIAINTFIRSTEALKTGGIFRYTRNPMYVSNLIYILGLNLMGLAGSLASLIFILATLYWIGGTHWSVLREEDFLERKFGDAYLQYKKKTPRYLII